MKVRDLVKICTSATYFSVWAGGQFDEGGEYYGTFGVFEELIAAFGSREVKSIYPAGKDVLAIEIAFK